MNYEIKSSGRTSCLCLLSLLHSTHRNATLRRPPIKELKTVFHVLYTTRISLYLKFSGTQRTGVNQQNFSREKAWSSLLSQALQPPARTRSIQLKQKPSQAPGLESRIRRYSGHQCAGLSKYWSCSLKTPEANQPFFGLLVKVKNGTSTRTKKLTFKWIHYLEPRYVVMFKAWDKIEKEEKKKSLTKK